MSKLADLDISGLEDFLLEEGIAGHIVSCLQGNTVVRVYDWCHIYNIVLHQKTFFLLKLDTFQVY